MAPSVTTCHLLSAGVEATEDLAFGLAQSLWPGAVLVLNGDLGAGKTAFVRGLARGLGITEPVASPTYTLMNAYEARLPLYHFDAWMEGRQKSLFLDGGDDWLYGAGVAAIEWGERVADWMPAQRLEVQLSHVGPQTRALRLCATEERPGPYAELLERLVLPEGISRAASPPEGAQAAEPAP